MRYRAYLFDVQGTLLDFFQPVSAAVARHLATAGARGVDAADVTRAWRANYFERLGAIAQSTHTWRRVQDEYALGFGEVCRQFGLAPPDPATAESVASSWQHLEPWPDVRDGLARIRATALTATLSNTDMSTMVALFKDLGIGWDAILTAEVFGAFKPEPQVYLRALRYLGVRPGDAALVACHPYDLAAAKALGMAAVFVHRPLEYGDPAYAHTVAAADVTQCVRDLREIE